MTGQWKEKAELKVLEKGQKEDKKKRDRGWRKKMEEEEEVEDGVNPGGLEEPH